MGNSKTTSKNRTSTKKPKKTLEKNEVTGIDFCGMKLTPLRRAFIVNYVTPGQPCFHNALQSALKAGYKPTVARTEIYTILRNPDIQEIIKVNETLAYKAIHEAAMRALEVKQLRAFYDPLDYFQEQEITVEGKHGAYTKSILALKSLEEMTPEQRLCIDSIDMKGQASVPIYVMADRGKELNDIIKIDRELSKTVADTGEEETREIIMERITIRETKRAERLAASEYEIIDRPEEAEEDV